MISKKRNLIVFFIKWMIPCVFFIRLFTLTTYAETVQHFFSRENNNTLHIQLIFSSKAKARVFTLSKPNRIVIDCIANKWDVPYVHLTYSIKKYHVNLFKKNVIRFVLSTNYLFIVKKIYVHKNVFFVDFVRKTVINLPNNRFYSYKHNIKNLFPKKEKKIFRRHRKPLIIIDPGHGGIDPGAIGIYGTYEKTANLEEAKVLARTLLSTGRYRVVLTRSRDIFVPLIHRYHIAEKLGASFFISLHADKSYSHNERGATVYTLSTKASDRIAENEATRENGIDNSYNNIALKKFDPIVSKALFDFEQSDTMKRTWIFAQLLVSELRHDIVLTSVPHRYAGFVVLKSPVVPSVLLEMGFISNIKDNKALFSLKHQKILAYRIVRAFDRYFSEIKK